MEDARSFQKSKSRVPTLGIDLLGGDQSSSEHLHASLSGLYKEIEDPFQLVVFASPDIYPQDKAFRIAKDLSE
ncbi:MAG: hypothetical protein AB7S94_10905, partial [Simkaniaceae bacterium]